MAARAHCLYVAPGMDAVEVHPDLAYTTRMFQARISPVAIASIVPSVSIVPDAVAPSKPKGPPGNGLTSVIWYVIGAAKLICQIVIAVQIHVWPSTERWRQAGSITTS
jgi:hypothetical protein